MMEEQQLIEKLRSGDNEAFRWLVDHYQTKILNLCYGYLHHMQEAEDVAQDVFIEVLRSIGTFRGDAGISTWLYRIAVNKSLNRRKKMQRMNLFYSLTGKTDETKEHGIENRFQAPATMNPDFNTLLEEDRRALQHAIDHLPKQQKTAFLLSKYENLSYSEIAEVMKTTLPAVESLLFRAKSNLRKLLERYMQ